ncbi:ArsR/SmtB family transcription factor [Streptomyces mayteni]
MALNDTDFHADDPDGRSLAPAVALFRSLGDTTRLAILKRLSHGEARVTELVAVLGLAQSTISSHLSCLRDCGLVDSRSEGRSSYYHLARPELMDLLTSAEQLLVTTEEIAASCPNYGIAAMSEEGAP